MAINTKIATVGTGVLTLGTDKTFDASGQVTAVELTNSVSEKEQIKFLDGSTGGGGAEYSYTLKATAIQNLTSSGLVAYLWAHKNEWVDFELVLNSEDGGKITGTVRCDPPNYGGDVGKENTTEISLPLLGEPTIVDAEKVNGQTP